MPQPFFKLDEIPTSRLFLRRIIEADLPALERTWTDGTIRKYLGGPLAQDKVEARRRNFMTDEGRLAITFRENDIVIGFCGLKIHDSGDPELTYTLLPEYWGSGFGLEASRAVIEWGLAYISECQRILAITQVANARSASLLEKLGMVRVEELIEYGEPQIMFAIYRGTSPTTAAPRSLQRPG
jgi:ribosomal-protein-alanine N-acetyltransferase